MEWLVEVGGSIGNAFTRNIFIPEEEIKSRASRFDSYYRTVFLYNNIEDLDQSDLKGDMYIDIDNNYLFDSENEFRITKRDTLLILNGLNISYGIPFEYMKLFFSGGKGFHITISNKVFGVESDKNLNLIYKEIAKDVSRHSLGGFVDMKIYDRRRLFRVVGTKHKYGNYKVQLKIPDLKEISQEQLLAYASRPRISLKEPIYKEIFKAKERLIEAKHKVENPDPNNRESNRERIFSEMLPCAINILDNGAQMGNRNNSTIALASSLFQCGKTLSEVEETLLEWNKEKNIPMISDIEILTTVRSAFKSFEDKNMRYGCNRMRELEYCVEECNVRKGRIQ